MKKNYLRNLFLVGLLLTTAIANGQDKKNSLGFGFQTSFPLFGLSAKYAITEQSVVQATLAPFGVGTYKLTYFGGRYLHRFPNSNNPNLEPYVYAGMGLLRTTINMSSYGGSKESNNTFSYSLGGGVEYSLMGNLGLSAEVGYGKMSFSAEQEAALSTITYGLGIHYYIK